MTKDKTDHTQIRIRSVRGYRRLADRIIVMATKGKMNPKDAAALVNSIKASTEMFMAETMLSRAGQDHENQKHQAGEDGGLVKLRPSAYRRKKVKAETGLDRFGARVDKTSVEIETSAEDKGAEEEAERETL